MKILISGASGLIGSALSASLEADGHRVLRLSRSESKERDSIQWQPESGRFDIRQMEKLDGVEAAFHLAGESVLGRWTPDKKTRIRDSRVRSTQLLSETLAKLPTPPRVLVCASAIGYYGNGGNRILRENCAAGRGFLAEVGREWEAAAQAARAAKIRTIHARFGIVLSKNGGALQKMLLPFSLGLGGPIGSGRQYLSWVGIDDVVGALRFALSNEKMEGAMNVTSPNPVSNRAFVQTLGRVLRRPAIMPLPAFALKIALGKEAATETLLTSQRVLPEKLRASGFQFQQPELESALREILN